MNCVTASAFIVQLLTQWSQTLGNRCILDHLTSYLWMEASGREQGFHKVIFLAFLYGSAIDFDKSK
ncbi:hypothetical protein M758_2G174900 [Ceratodon purpureus]|uniref:Uncharacterized protein n=1 Tax=Ceratodon purpureus TaxID=3225 RepID=A0A8T0J0L3_CERPU|nr:hypothetical protein KC19_2G222900 [Ceratodon purpureus]KAG0627117.1 hypothetical protein M758_2G174900 [Ceratodon purpureus]